MQRFFSIPIIFVLSCLSVFYLSIISVQAKIIQVPSDISSIQGGIDYATDGDTVLVAEGLYFENINFKGKAITVCSHFIVDGDTSHISRTIIDGSKPANPDSGSVLYFISGEDTTSVLCGLKISGGTGTYYIYDGYEIRFGGGIFTFKSGGKIINNIISENHIRPIKGIFGIGAGFSSILLPENCLIIKNNTINYNTIFSECSRGAGVSLCADGHIVFQSNVLVENSCSTTSEGSAGGGAVYVFKDKTDKGKTYIRNNKIIGNKCASGKSYKNNWGGGLFSSACSPAMSNNHIIGNIAGYGAGIRICGTNSEEIQHKASLNNDFIEYNTAHYGGGVGTDGSNLKLTNVLIKNNYAKYGGGIAYFEHSNLEIDSTRLIDNEGSINGGGIYCMGSSELNMQQSNIERNIAGDGGGVFCAGNNGTESANINLSHVIISGNSANNENGGGIKCMEFSSLSLDKVEISDNSSEKYGGGMYCYYSNITCSDVLIRKNYARLCGGGIYRNYGSKIDFDEKLRSSLYLNEASENGCEIYNKSGQVLSVSLDTFTVKEPQDQHACPIERFVFNILNHCDPSVDIVGSPERLVLKVALFQNYPNPFNPVTTIEYQLAKASDVDLSIYNFLGQKVSTLVSEKQKAGSYILQWDASGFASGIYVYRLVTNNGFSQTKKLILMK